MNVGLLKARSLAVVDDNGFEYNDITVYKGQFYVIDTLGNVSWIDNLSLIDTLIKKGGGQNIPSGMLEIVMVPKCLISKCIS